MRQTDRRTDGRVDGSKLGNESVQKIITNNTLGLNPYFSANPPYRSLSFFFFRIHYMDFPDCLLLPLSISVSLLFSFFCFYTFLVVGSAR